MVALLVHITTTSSNLVDKVIDKDPLASFETRAPPVLGRMIPTGIKNEKPELRYVLHIGSADISAIRCLHAEVCSDRREIEDNLEQARMDLQELKSKWNVSDALGGYRLSHTQEREREEEKGGKRKRCCLTLLEYCLLFQLY